ncbi:MAG: mevalonate kinase, partial [Verrucomicrobiota bacterium]
PSDGYYGKTISFVFQNAAATVTLYETPEIQFLPGPVDDHRFKNTDAMLRDIRLYGYYGGLRLLKATTKIFHEYCREYGIPLPKRNFTARYHSTIPRLVGLSGSSAICTAMFRALMQFYNVSIPREIIPTLCWRAESEQLTITCGMQDRVIQVYQGCQFMDFDKTLMESRNYGRYESIDPTRLPPLYLAYDPSRAEVSGRYHGRLRVLFEEQKSDIVAAMDDFAAFAEEGYLALIKGDLDTVRKLINANFDLRDKIFNVSDSNRRMVQTARSTGATAKFAGSGGAIVGTYDDEAMYEALTNKLGAIGCHILKPDIAPQA